MAQVAMTSMSVGARSIESIVYNKVAYDVFQKAGGFTAYPGISVSKKGWVYVKVEDRFAPLMIMFGDDQVSVRGCYPRKSEDGGYRLLSEFPEAFCTGANDLFRNWYVASGIVCRSEPKKLVGNTYMNYKHAIDTAFPISLKAFGVIPMFYDVKESSTSLRTAYSGISIRVSPSTILQFTAAAAKPDNDAGSSDEIVFSRGPIASRQVKLCYDIPKAVAEKALESDGEEEAVKARPAKRYRK